MAKQLKEIEIPFGAKDSELCDWEYTIPEGMEATIVDNKIVVKKKESEDESIRKEIIKFVKFYYGSSLVYKNTVSKDDMVTWIEKQTFTKKDVDDAYLEGVTTTKNEIEKQYEETYQIRKDIATFFFYYRGDIKDRSKWMDYLGFKVSSVESKVKKYKSADKIEPKFREGEWLCGRELNNYARFIQILEIVNVQGKDRYRISRDIHKDEDVVEFGFVEKYYHKFDIQDAKDGDVLACNEEILLFKSYSVQNRISLYCWYNGQTNNFHDKEVTDTSVTTRNKILPATKEQRDLLFKKMKEAGYEWDAEKKELKKIENEIPFGAKDSELQEVTYFIPKGFHAEIDDDKVVIKKGEKPTAWSEEDEEIINKISIAIAAIYSCSTAAKVEKWLKSLKERYTWKPSELQIEALESATENCAYSEYQDCLRELIEQLKKLKE